MDWAINSAGDHIEAGTPSAYGYSLRCPVCKAHVYHRHGVYNRPHFAHHSGNFNRACELYRPGAGIFTGASGRPNSLVSPPNFESPVLVWRDSSSVSLGLQLRLPRIRAGYASTLSIISSLGQQKFQGEDLTRTLFARLPLQEPPAHIETSPRDPAIEMQVEVALDQFRLSGNYFRATVTGGVLERRDAPLELGEEYFFVSQRLLPKPYPPSLILTREPRQHRSWMMYRVLLRDDPNTHDKDLADLKSYLGRQIDLPRHRINVIWPPPHRFDADGAPVFSSTTGQLIVRSNAGRPNVEAEDSAAPGIDELGGGLYQLTFERPSGEAVVWIPSGSVQRLSFQETSLSSPCGVMLVPQDRTVDLTSPAATEIAAQAGTVRILVPSELLWRKAKLAGHKLRPLPAGMTHSFEGPLQSIDFGAFGFISPPQKRAPGSVGKVPWYAKVERFVVAISGPVASARLKSIRSRQQLVRWAVENKAMRVLPIVLSAYSAEEDRGVS